MTSPTRDQLRDEIAQIIDGLEPGGPIKVVFTADYSIADKILDRVIAAGLVVPEGMTAKRMRDIAKAYRHYQAEVIGPGMYGVQRNADLLDAWADALGVPETTAEG